MPPDIDLGGGWVSPAVYNQYQNQIYGGFYPVFQNTLDYIKVRNFIVNKLLNQGVSSLCGIGLQSQTRLFQHEYRWVRHLFEEYLHNGRNSFFLCWIAPRWRPVVLEELNAIHLMQLSNDLAGLFQAIRLYRAYVQINSGYSSFWQEIFPFEQVKNFIVNELLNQCVSSLRGIGSQSQTQLFQQDYRLVGHLYDLYVHIGTEYFSLSYEIICPEAFSWRPVVLEQLEAIRLMQLSKDLTGLFKAIRRYRGYVSRPAWPPICH